MSTAAARGLLATAAGGSGTGGLLCYVWSLSEFPRNGGGGLTMLAGWRVIAIRARRRASGHGPTLLSDSIRMTETIHHHPWPPARRLLKEK